MRLIDADALMKIYTDRMSAVAERYSIDSSECGILAGAMKLLETQPIIAQPEIIRCKDCKYQEKEWREDKRFKDNGYWVYGCKVLGDVCGYWAWFGQDNEFCSDAERRTDG